MGTIIQGNKEFGFYEIGTGNIVYYLIRENGKDNTKKNIAYNKCDLCGKIIGSVMGGYSKHAKSCRQKYQKEAQELQDKINWYGGTSDDRKRLDEIKVLWLKETGKEIELENKIYP